MATEAAGKWACVVSISNRHHTNKLPNASIQWRSFVDSGQLEQLLLCSSSRSTAPPISTPMEEETQRQRYSSSWFYLIWFTSNWWSRGGRDIQDTSGLRISNIVSLSRLVFVLSENTHWDTFALAHSATNRTYYKQCFQLIGLRKMYPNGDATTHWLHLWRWPLSVARQASQTIPNTPEAGGIFFQWCAFNENQIHSARIRLFCATTKYTYHLVHVQLQTIE